MEWSTLLKINSFTEILLQETACTYNNAKFCITKKNTHFRVGLDKVIKVSDFGLSMDIYAKNYFQPTSDQDTKMPIKWMAIESFNDGVYSEKSDVVCIRSLSFQGSVQLRITYM